MDGSDRPGVVAPDTPDPGKALCDLFVASLPIAGASISVVAESGEHSVVGASDPLAAQLEAWQFESGQGPHWDALRTQQPAFLYDLNDAAAEQVTWLAPAMNSAPGAGALFAFPLQLGAATLGVADLYTRTAADRWPDETVDLARHLATSVTASAIRLATRSADAGASQTGQFAVELRREVHQAVGMVMVQLDTDASTALLRLRGHAFADNMPLDAVAREVIKREIDFSRL